MSTNKPPTSKLSLEDKQLIIELRSRGFKLKTIANKFNVSPQNIQKLCKRRTAQITQIKQKINK